MTFAALIMALGIYTSQQVSTVSTVSGTDLAAPRDVAVDGNGNVYIADSAHARIRKIDQSGTLTTLLNLGILGCPADDFYGIGVDAAGNVYVAEYWCHRVLRIDAVSNAVTIVAGSGAAIPSTLLWPTDVAVDAAGNLYIVDRNAVRKIAIPSGSTTSYPLPAPGAQAFLTLDAGGNVLVAANDTVEIIQAGSSGTVTTIQFSVGGSITGIAVSANNKVYVSAFYSGLILLDLTLGTATTIVPMGCPSTGDGGAPIAATTCIPWGVATKADGTILVTQYGDGILRRIDLGGSTIQQPTDTTTGTKPVLLEFSEIVLPGSTSLSSSSSGPTPPSDFKLGVPPTYFDITTTAVFSGSLNICINYSGVDYHNPATLRLFHYENGAWVDVTSWLNTNNYTLCGVVTSLSPFLAVESVYLATVQQPIEPDGTSVFNARRGVVPLRFKLFKEDTPTCNLPPAMLSLVQTSGGSAGPVNEGLYTDQSDSGLSFHVTNCQYVYNLSVNSLQRGTYVARILINAAPVGSAQFTLR